MTIIAIILSLSVFANAFAVSEDKDSSNKDKSNNNNKKIPTPPDAGDSSQLVRAKDNNKDGSVGSSNNDDDNTHHQVKQIGRLFRSNNDDEANSINNIPVIPRMNFEVVNGTNSTTTMTTASVTIPICDGIVPGPCLDKTTGQIIP